MDRLECVQVHDVVCKLSAASCFKVTLQYNG